MSQPNYTNVPYPVIELTEATINRTPETELLEIATHQLKQSNILEIGSGTGRLAANFINNCASYLGIEKSSSMLLACNNRLAKFVQHNEFKTYFLHGDFFDIEFCNPIFDIIILTDYVLCYQNDYRTIKKMLKKIESIRTADGTILLDIPIISQRMKKDISTKEVEYSCSCDKSSIEIKRTFLKNDALNYTFLYEATYITDIDLSLKYHWQLNFFYPEKEVITKMIDTIFPKSKIKEIIYNDDSIESIFYLIKQ